MSGVGSRALEISANHRLELLESAGLDVELSFQIGTHLALHLVDLPKGDHALIDDTPGFVGICVVADDLGAIVNAKMKRRCLEELRAVGNQVSSLCWR